MFSFKTEIYRIFLRSSFINYYILSYIPHMCICIYTDILFKAIKITDVK